MAKKPAFALPAKKPLPASPAPTDEARGAKSRPLMPTGTSRPNRMIQGWDIGRGTDQSAVVNLSPFTVVSMRRRGVR
jgi:hypothetical protein